LHRKKAPLFYGSFYPVKKKKKKKNKKKTKKQKKQKKKKKRQNKLTVQGSRCSAPPEHS